MALDLKQLTSGMFSRALLNSNFQKIEDKVNNDLLHRQNGSSVMKQDIDMDSNNVYNVNELSLSGGRIVATESYVDGQDSYYDSLAQQREIQLTQQVADEAEEALLAERAQRITTDNDLQDQINVEAETRELTDTDLQEQIDQEIQDRIDEDLRYDAININRDLALYQTIDQESLARQQADAQLGTRISVETEDRIDGDQFLDTKISNIQDFLSGDIVLKAPNTRFVDVTMPWDIGGLDVSGNPFNNENIPSRRVSLSEGASTRDLGSIV